MVTDKELIQQIARRYKGLNRCILTPLEDYILQGLIHNDYLSVDDRGVIVDFNEVLTYGPKNV